jgi:hypothetical protein
VSPPAVAGGAAAAPTPTGSANDDPEQNARAFAERSRKEAQDELKKLKEEAERLRTRLGKVEAGIRRWEALLTSLDNSERIAQPEDLQPIPKPHPARLEPGADEPYILGELEPRAARSLFPVESTPPASSPTKPDGAKQAEGRPR